ncbi:hypothetical protein E2562_028767 [Oryza meyeriana var. granulata]|uniref:FAR1 domain-containing protein n=1 Tax=Oryza meyeriana var. granulata TaxID=110450 RepID=A0A6G1E285_9ORYZ|nr:hypothetical protein E2562_028767 [Oryza meyeriana var. granulata]
MAFKTCDEAYEFYMKYAYHADFDVRKSRGKKTVREFCCNHEGKHTYNTDATDIECKRLSKRTGCKAYAKIKSVLDDGEVSSVVLDVVGLNHTIH